MVDKNKVNEITQPTDVDTGVKDTLPNNYKCPVCGYSFDSKKRKVIKCPECNALAGKGD